MFMLALVLSAKVLVSVAAFLTGWAIRTSVKECGAVPLLIVVSAITVAGWAGFAMLAGLR